MTLIITSLYKCWKNRRKEKKKRKEEGKVREKKWTNKNKYGRENYKENIGTKLVTNTKKQKLKI